MFTAESARDLMKEISSEALELVLRMRMTKPKQAIFICIRRRCHYILCSLVHYPV